MSEHRSIGRTIAALSRPVVGSMALAVGGLVLFRGVAPFEVLRESNDVVGNYLQTLGSIYAVLLAFVMFVVWTQFNDARANVEREANELLDLYRTARGLPEPTRGQVQASALALRRRGGGQRMGRDGVPRPAGGGRRRAGRWRRCGRRCTPPSRRWSRSARSTARC